MRKKYIYIYSYLEEEIKRITEPVVRRLVEKYNFERCIVIYSKKCSPKKRIWMPSKTKMIRLSSLRRKKIEKIVSQYPPSLLLVAAQRIPDMLMLSYFNRWKIPTVLMQHGMLVDFLPRISMIPLVLGNLKKVWNYIGYAIKISQLNQISKTRILRDVFRLSITGDKKIAESGLLKKANIIAENALIFDRTWDDFFKNMYGYQKEQFVYIGTIDLALLKEIKHRPQEKSVCYICQTLVEDGRYPRRRYLSFIKILATSLSDDKRLYVKLHPRSDRSLFQELENKPNIIFVKEFPHCSKYLGHYSSMLELAFYCSPFIFLWDFEDHKIPEYFKKYGYRISHNSEELAAFIAKDERDLSFPEKYRPLSDHEIDRLDPIGDACAYLVHLHLRQEEK